MPLAKYPSKNEQLHSCYIDRLNIEVIQSALIIKIDFKDIESFLTKLKVGYALRILMMRVIYAILSGRVLGKGPAHGHCDFHLSKPSLSRLLQVDFTTYGSKVRLLPSKRILDVVQG